MWLLRGIFGLIFLGLAVITVPVWFDSPSAVIFTIVFASLGLWIMGWVTWLSSKKTQDKNILQEIQIRRSKYFSFRNRIMGFIALLLGVAGMYLTYQSNWQIGWKALGGSIMFIFLGMWYLIKGSKAEGTINTPTRRP